MKQIKRFHTLGLIGLVLVLAACAQAQANEPIGAEKTPQSLASGVQEIGGVVLGGGDTTPAGLMDTPRSFVYQVKLDGGEEINVAYTAYPPSPAGDKQPKVKLSFYAGEIQVGDYLSARGTYDAANKTLTVAAAGDFIQTFEKKP